MTLRLTGANVPTLLNTGGLENSVFHRLPIEDFMKLRGFNSPFFETDMGTYWDDFMGYIGPTAEGTANNWKLTGTGSSVGGLVNDVGLIRLGTDTAIPSQAQLEYQANGPGGGWRIRSNRITWFFSFFTLRQVATTGAFFGLGTPGTADVFNTLPVNGYFFVKADTSLRWDFHVRAGGVSTIITDPFGQDLANNAQVMGFYSFQRNFTPVSIRSIHPLVVNPLVLSNDPNNPGDQNPLVPIWGINRSASGDARMDIDWVYFAHQDVD